MYYKRTVNKLFQIILTVVIFLGLLSGCVAKDVSTSTNLVSPTSTVSNPVSTATSSQIAFNPTKVGEWQIPAEIKAVDANNRIDQLIGKINGKDYLFLIATDDQPTEIDHGTGCLLRIIILDLTDPLKPTEVGYIHTDSFIDLLDMQLSSNILYVSTMTYLWIIDVSHPANPHEIARYNANQQFAAVGCTIFNSYAYINNYSSKFVQLNITNPSNPKLIGDLPYVSLKPGLVRAFGSHFFDYLPTGNDSGIHIIDISNPDSVKEIGYYSTPVVTSVPSMGLTEGRIWDLTVSGNYMYLAATDHVSDTTSVSSIQVVNVANLNSPSETSRITIPGMIVGKIVVSGNYAYVMAENRNRGITSTLKIIDISDPGNLKLIGDIGMSNDVISNPTFGFILVGDYIYKFVGVKTPAEIFKTR